MLAEFFDRIVGLAKGAHQVEFKTHDELPRQVFVRHGDKLEVHEAPPPFRKHHLVGYDDFEAQMVELRVMSDECLRVSNLAVGAVISRLQESLPDVPVFHGNP